MKQNSLVSVIMAAYNAEVHVESAIRSVLNQTYNNFELIVVDDASSDSTLKKIEKLSKFDSRIKVYTNIANRGVVNSRNFATKKAQGKYIAFLDSDDLWLPEKLNKQIGCAQRENIPLLFSGYYKITPNEVMRGEVKVPKSVDYQKLLKSNYMGCLTVMYDQEKMEKFYFEEINMSEDYLLWLQMLKKIKKAVSVQEPLAKYRVASRTRASNKFKAVFYQWRIYRDYENLNIFDAFYYFLHYIIIGYRRYII
ncbi:MAG: glycosyltransferase family 2 protein [Fusobacteria bacterium]|nr:glycosyltransferase family 2 protein [Fusobacteriota bacterium]